jgi:hypothetical protein
VKVVSYTALHYGREYLAYAIRSVIDHVDEHHILYSAVGSHGHRTDVSCPEKRDELYAIAQQAAGDKLRWHEGEWAHEGLQRDSIYEYAPDADVILVVDADEVWNEAAVSSALTMYSEAVLIGCKTWRVPMIHYWRSFYRAMTDDRAYPVRVIFPQVEHTWETDASYVNHFGQNPLIHHFGYAQTPRVVQYKQWTHGHKNEWRKDIDWFSERFMANAQRDVHPTNLNYWNPTDVDPHDILPTFMREHPFYHLALIE